MKNLEQTGRSASTKSPGIHLRMNTDGLMHTFHGTVVAFVVELF